MNPKSMNLSIHHLASTYLVAERLVDDNFMTAIEMAWVDYSEAPTTANGNETPYYLYENPSVGSRPREVALARSLSVFIRIVNEDSALHPEDRDMGKAAEALRLSMHRLDPISTELCKDFLFETVGGQDHKALALELLKTKASLGKQGFSDNLDSIRSKKASTQQNSGSQTQVEGEHFQSSSAHRLGHMIVSKPT